MGNPWNTGMLHWTGNVALQVIQLLYTNHTRGETYICGGILTTVSHHAWVVHNRTSHQSIQGIDTKKKQDLKTPSRFEIATRKLYFTTYNCNSQLNLTKNGS